MTYFISGHRDITPEEFEKFYVPAIVDVIDTCDNNYDDCEFVVGDCRGCDEMAANFIANYIRRIQMIQSVFHVFCAFIICSLNLGLE